MATVWDLSTETDELIASGNSPARGQVTSSRAVARNASGWWNMIRRDGVTQIEENTGVVHRLHGWHFFGHIVKERRPFDVCGVIVPRIEMAIGCLQLGPRLATFLNARINVLEHGRNHVLLLDGVNFSTGGVDVPQEDRRPVARFTQRLRFKVDVDSSCGRKQSPSMSYGHTKSSYGGCAIPAMA